jgi:hypothetical protein
MVFPSAITLLLVKSRICPVFVRSATASPAARQLSTLYVYGCHWNSAQNHKMIVFSTVDFPAIFNWFPALYPA